MDKADLTQQEQERKAGALMAAKKTLIFIKKEFFKSDFHAILCFQLIQLP